MKELKQVEITLTILDNVRKENTGSRNKFASHLGISPRHLTKYIRKIEAVRNVNICFCTTKQSYCYLDKPVV